MRKLHSLLSVCALSLSFVFAPSPQARAADQGQLGPGVPAFTVRPGYRVTVAADKLGEARFMEFDDHGNLYLSQPGHGSILQLSNPDGEGKFQTRTEFVSGYPSVQGMFFKDGWLYFAQAGSGSLSKAKIPDSNNGVGKAEKVETVLPPNTLPAGGGHPFNGVLVTDDSIYITVSDPRNMTSELDSDRKTIYRFDVDGKNKRVFATGIRNTEKIRFRPGTTEIYGCDHGSDNFGGKYGDVAGSDQPITDLNPPEKLNLYVEGGFYGHPYLTGNKVPRPEYANRPDLHELADKMIAPAWCFHAHWAICGFTFLSKDYFPGHKGDMFVASHGSWNSMHKVGYRVERVCFDPMTGKPYGTMPIVITLATDGTHVLARPVDCAEASDGTVLFSSDATSTIYRISKAQ